MSYFMCADVSPTEATESGLAWTGATAIGEWFERSPNNPLAIPQGGATGVVHPDILYFPEGHDGYTFWLYYTPYPPPGLENPCLARSNDGFQFSDEDLLNPLLTRTEPWEARHLADVDVVVVGDSMFMYYVGVNSCGTACIGVAVSGDGKRWTKSPENPILYPVQRWEGAWVGAPTVYYENSRFWMWYAGGYTEGIGLAGSTDGIHWVRENGGEPVMTGTPAGWDGGGISHPNVIFYGDTFWMYYWGIDEKGTAHCRLGLAKSADKVTWVKSAYNPVLDIVPHTWEGYHIYRSSPVIIADTMWLYYSAYDDLGTTVPHIGLAKSYSFLRGDENNDNRISIADALFIVNYIFRNGPAPLPLQAGDANCDGNITVGDAIFIVAYLFLSGPAPCGG